MSVSLFCLQLSIRSVLTSKPKSYYTSLARAGAAAAGGSAHTNILLHPLILLADGEVFMVLAVILENLSSKVIKKDAGDRPLGIRPVETHT